jgi:hypothetical protein
MMTATMDDDIDSATKRQVIDEELIPWRNTLFLHDLRLRGAREVGDDAQVIDPLVTAIDQYEAQIAFLCEQRALLGDEPPAGTGDVPIAVKRLLIDQEVVNWKKNRFRAGLRYAAAQQVKDTARIEEAFKGVERCEGYLAFLKAELATLDGATE